MGVRAAPWRGLAYRLATVVAIFGLWEAAQSIPLGDPDLFPRPSAIAAQSWNMITSGALLTNGTQSVVRILSGWGLGALLGIPIGMGMGSWRAIEETVGTVVHFLRPISPIAWIPLAILLFGLGFGGPVFVVFLAAFYPTVLAAAAAVREVETVQMDAVRTLGASGFAVYWEVVVPGATPGILMGLRIALGNAWGAVVGAEMFGAQGGLGYLITEGVVFFELSDVMVGMVLIGVTGLLLDALYVRFMDRSLHWMPRRGMA